MSGPCENPNGVVGRAVGFGTQGTEMWRPWEMLKVRLHRKSEQHVEVLDLATERILEDFIKANLVEY